MGSEKSLRGLRCTEFRAAVLCSYNTYFPSPCGSTYGEGCWINSFEKGKQTKLFSSVKMNQIKKLSIWVVSLFLFFLPSFPSLSFSLSSFLSSLLPSFLSSLHFYSVKWPVSEQLKTTELYKQEH